MTLRPRPMRALMMAGVLAFGVAVALTMTSCVSNDTPDAPGDACAIFEQNEGWWRSVKSAQRRWGAPPALQLAIIRAESGFDAEARPPRGKFLFIFPGARLSSARGYAQALESTWAEYESARGDDGLDRDEFGDAADFVSWYARGTKAELDLPYSDARGHYLAYHEGRAGYRRGSYEDKRPLLSTAARVQRWRNAYHRQLSACEDDLNRWWWPF